MKISGVNHITFSVSSLEASLGFYQELLGFECAHRWDKGAYLTLGQASDEPSPVWLCLSQGQAQAARDYSHIAFTVEPNDMPRWREALEQGAVRFWQENRSEGDSLYILDPDGHKLELHVGSLQSRLASIQE